MAGLRIPGVAADYTDGRFTDGCGYGTPAAHTYFGVWVEQLAAMLPAKPVVKNSLEWRDGLCVSGRQRRGRGTTSVHVLVPGAGCLLGAGGEHGAAAGGLSGDESDDYE